VAATYFAVTYILFLYAGLGMALGLFNFLTTVWLQPGAFLAPTDWWSDGSMLPIVLSSFFWGAVGGAGYVLSRRFVHNEDTTKSDDNR